MGQERLNALLLLFVHQDIHVDADEVVDVFANEHPRRMRLTKIPCLSHNTDLHCSTVILENKRCLIIFHCDNIVKGRQRLAQSLVH